MRKVEIDERIDQVDQFEENDDTNKEIWIHWLFESLNWKRRDIKIA